MLNTKDSWKSKIIFFFLINICFTLLFMSSPLYDFSVYIGDSGIYQSIAREMLNGKILYKEAFDHKGPFIFFIYIIPLLFKNVNIGTFILDVILYNSIFYLHYKTLRLKRSELFTWLVLLIEMFFLYKFHVNLCPESFVLLTLSYMNYWILSKQYLNPTKLQLLICGVLTGLVFWIKFSLGVPIAIIYFYVIYNIFKNKLPGKINYFIYPLLGFMIPTVVVLGYFIYHGAVSDLIYSYFIVNTRYSNPSSDFNFDVLIYYLIGLVLMLVGMLIYNFIKKNKEYTFLCITYLILIIPVFIMTKSVFAYYFIPFLCIAALPGSIEVRIDFNKYFKISFLTFLSLLLILELISMGIDINNVSSSFKRLDKFGEDVGAVESVSTFYFAGNPILANLDSTNYKYSIFTNLTIEQYPEMWQEIYDDVSNKEIEYIIFRHKDIENFDMKDFNRELFFDNFNINLFFQNCEATKQFILDINDEVIENYDFFNSYGGYVVLKRK